MELHRWEISKKFSWLWSIKYLQESTDFSFCLNIYNENQELSWLQTHLCLHLKVLLLTSELFNYANENVHTDFWVKESEALLSTDCHWSKFRWYIEVCKSHPIYLPPKWLRLHTKIKKNKCERINLNIFVLL